MAGGTDALTLAATAATAREHILLQAVGASEPPRSSGEAGMPSERGGSESGARERGLDAS